MIGFQRKHQNIIFDTWLLYYKIPTNTCEDMKKYLYLMFEVTKRNFFRKNWFYIKPLGDNMELIIYDFCSKVNKLEEFDIFLDLIHEWFTLGVFDIVFLTTMKERIFYKKREFLGEGDLPTEENLEDYNGEIACDNLVSKLLISEINSKFIK